MAAKKYMFSITAAPPITKYCLFGKLNKKEQDVLDILGQAIDFPTCGKKNS